MKFFKRLIDKLSRPCDFRDKGTRVYPSGWTETKCSENSHICRIPSSLNEQWNEERREKDKVDQLMSENGFYNIGGGRAGYIYYVEDAHVCEMGYEGCGGEACQIGLYPIDLRKWIIPEGKSIDEEHQLKILRSMRQWLKSQKLKSSIDLPSELIATDLPCVWPDCGERKIKGLPYCLYHSDLFLLRGQGLRGSILEN